jgi:hypothetical protein
MSDSLIGRFAFPASRVNLAHLLVLRLRSRSI